MFNPKTIFIIKYVLSDCIDLTSFFVVQQITAIIFRQSMNYIPNNAEWIAPLIYFAVFRLYFMRTPGMRVFNLKFTNMGSNHLHVRNLFHWLFSIFIKIIPIFAILAIIDFKLEKGFMWDRLFKIKIYHEKASKQN